MMTITVGVDGPISAQSEFKPAIVSAPVDTENASIVAGHGPILGMPLLVAGLIAFAPDVELQRLQTRASQAQPMLRQFLFKSIARHLGMFNQQVKFCQRQNWRA